MSYKSGLLQKIAAGRPADTHLRRAWSRESHGFTLEDYQIWAGLIGHRLYRIYNTAHWRDVDITTKNDVWFALRGVK